MYFSTDKLYKLSKEALRGKKQGIVYAKLIDWTKEEFDIKVIYIDLVIKNKGNQPRLHLILETRKDYQKILIESGYNPKIQSKIAKKFNELLKIENQKNGKKTKQSFIEKLLFNIGLKSNLKQNFENIWVCYSVFLTVYSTEISTEFTKEKIDELIKKYKKDNVWEIHLSSFYITIFLEKENQIEESRQKPLFEKLKDEYFEIVKEKDEFGLFKKELINLAFDSKENFDKNYEGNWFYYYK
jgi:hypothetical protein